MTGDEILLVSALAGCALRPRSADRRFCRELAEITRNQETPMLADGQRAYLWRIALRYRLQLPPDLFEMAMATHTAAVGNLGIPGSDETSEGKMTRPAW